ncbi:class I SAM-dependent methyltransferase [Paraburkholderia bannensis]|uniref:class I SAM-dependent methyltransferase n=1 Tax=Paraburkholderia bannensis TaxID=765414 RepID=UPI002ABE63C6|nr:class I SAM-dependent methyltransferase [Paraburkholderia bannensis]
MTSTNHDPFRFSTIAHRNHRYLSPLSRSKASELIRSLSCTLTADDFVLDAGCGKASLLRDVLCMSSARGVGVDINQDFLNEARASFQQECPADSRLSLINAPLLEHARPEERYSAILCVGSTHAFGSFEECLRVSRGWLKPDGLLLVAEGYWKQAPSQEYLALLGGTADEFGTHAENAQLARALGYNLVRTATSSDDEWDEYEGKYCDAMMQYLAANHDDPDAVAFLKRMQEWHSGYLSWGRATLGFGYYLLARD